MSFFITQILCVSCWVRFLVYFVTVNKFELCFIKKLSPLGKVEQRTLILKVFYWQAFCNVATVAVKVQRKLFSTTLFSLFTVLELKSDSCISSASSCMLQFQHFGRRVNECGVLPSAKHWVKNELVGQSICSGAGGSTLHTVRLCMLCGLTFCFIPEEPCCLHFEKDYLSHNICVFFTHLTLESGGEAQQTSHEGVKVASVCKSTSRTWDWVETSVLWNLPGVLLWEGRGMFQNSL